MYKQTRLDEFLEFSEIVRTEIENQKRVRKVYDDRTKQKSVCRQTNFN